MVDQGEVVGCSKKLPKDEKPADLSTVYEGLPRGSYHDTWE